MSINDEQCRNAMHNMMVGRHSPFEEAHSCVQSLHAISDLITQASTGCSDMNMVNPDHLAHLLNTILERLDSALDAMGHHGRAVLS